MTDSRILMIAAIACVGIVAIACNDNGRISEQTNDGDRHAIPTPTLADNRPVHLQGLHNIVAYADGLYSGGAPEGVDGFESLRELGIKTIISVDGAQPDVDAAKARGMRYVHLPIGYNGMDKDRTLEIARAVKELPGPIYVHCHHGKHRSAGATGAAAVTLGYMTNAEATQRMKVSGTSPHYVGLYECVAIASIADHQEILAASNAFPERWKTTGLVRSMVEIDEAFEHLKRIEAAGWKSPARHPDLVPVAEAGYLADLLRNLKDDERCRAKPGEFMDWMMAASNDAGRIEAELLRENPSMDTLRGHWVRLSASCVQCHAKYRD